MLRDFIKCKTTEERMNYIVNSDAADWTEAEVKTVMEIVGVKGDYSEATKEDKLNIIAATLGFVKEAEVKDKSIFTRIKDDDSEKIVDPMDMEYAERVIAYSKYFANYTVRA